MKHFLKRSIVVISILVGAALPLTGFFFLWSWCMAQVPMTESWAGLAKIAITLGMIAVGGGVTITIAILAALAAAALAAILLDA